MNEPRVIESVTNECQSLGRAHESSSARAEQLIACLEGEIAKRDETIARLEPQLNRAIQANYDLREELSALKAQEPVAWAGAIEYGVPLLMVEPQNWKATPLYAAPVSEDKAQGVVQWPDADEIMQMAFEEGQPADDASGYCFELEEFDLFIERLMSDVARLNAAPAAPAADAVASLIEWTKDAVEWGGALNYAAWEFVNECPEKSALLFNNTKGPLRAAIMKYAEIVAANAKDSSHD